MEQILEYLNEYSVEVLALLGGLYTVMRAIVLLTPTPKDDQLFKKADGYLSKILGILAKAGGLDTTQGMKKKETTKENKTIVSLLIYALIISSCVGCTSWNSIKKDPRAEVLAYSKMYEQTVTTLTKLNTQGVFSEEQKVTITALVDKGAAYLLLWHDTIETTNQRPTFADNAIYVIESLATYLVDEGTEQ